jgi:hypothetical protein
MNEYKYNSNTYGYSRIGTAESGNFWFTGFNTKYTGTELGDDDSLHIGTVSRNLYSKKDFKKNS